MDQHQTHKTRKGPFLTYFSIFDLWCPGKGTTYAISGYHHWYCEFDSQPGRGVQHNVITFVSGLLRLHTSSIVIDRYSNFGNTYLSKEFARVLGTGQIVTSLEHLAQYRGVQVTSLCGLGLTHVRLFWQINISKSYTNTHNITST
jgi:hypothetical protein